MRVPRLRLILAVVAIVLIFFIVTSLLRLESASLTISTATRGGTYYVIGEQLAHVLEATPGQLLSSVRVLRSPGSQENLDRLLRSEADLALVMKPAFESLDEEDRGKLRVLARRDPPAGARYESGRGQPT